MSTMAKPKKGKKAPPVRFRAPSGRAHGEAYAALLARCEDLEDRLAFIEGARDAAATDGRNLLPDRLAGRLLDGAHPVNVWREHRGLTANSLAERAGVAASYLSEIVAGKKPGSVGAYQKLADALGVTVDDLLPAPA